MDYGLNEAQLLLRNSVREFLRKECPKNYIKELEEKEEYPEKLFRKMAEKGWLGISIPEKYGGCGGDSIDIAIMAEELGRCWVSLGLVWGTSNCFGGRTIYCHGTEEQKKTLLPKLCSGKIRFAGAFTEPGGGTDLLAMKTNAYKENDNWIINGQKTFITNALEADYLITIARTNKNPAKRAAAFTIFLIDAHSAGIQMNKLHKLGSWGADADEIFFADVKVPSSAVIGEVDRGFYQLTDTLNTERIMVSGLAVGISEAVLEDALEYAKQRQAFGKPLGQFQRIQNYFAEMKIEIDAARLLVFRASWLESQGLPCGMEATMADYFASEVAHKCANKGMRIMAGAGYVMDNPMQRYFRDSVIPLFAPISNEMCLDEVARNLGLPRSY